AEDPHRHRDDRRRAGLDRPDVDSRAGDPGGERGLKRSDEKIRVLALAELEEQLRVIGSGRLRPHREPESWSTGADKRSDRGEHRRPVGGARMGSIVLLNNVDNDVFGLPRRPLRLRERSILWKTNIHVGEVEIVPRKELAVELAGEESAGSEHDRRRSENLP